ncbi:3'-5' exonuclease [Kaistia sp. MMO-174]|uniref:3'-5' exonuclease n=1 Tax=Kaistia sp. MMO-174 TaxID=3081256 RepID=UPI003018A2ED
MSGFLILDTETSGLFDFTQPADAPGQPHLAQVGLIYLDHVGATPRRKGAYVRPNGWSMEAGASAVNGLTDQFLREHGTDVEMILDTYEQAIDEGRVVVAFNAQFDTKVMRAELRRSGRPDLFERTRNICVMRPMMKLGVQKAGSSRGYPKLSDCCAHFGIARSGAHDALGDAEDALAIFLKLHELGALPAPAVHYAKNRP